MARAVRSLLWRCIAMKRKSRTTAEVSLGENLLRAWDWVLTIDCGVGPSWLPCSPAAPKASPGE